MQLSVFGINHRQAPVELRERLAVPAARLPEALAALRSACGAAESVLLSTCNRVEVYTLSNGEPLTVGPVALALSQLHAVEPGAFSDLLYHHEGEGAVRHLFRVAAGLDSMVVGETQILAQVKNAYQAARTCAASGRVLNHLFQRSLNVAKAVHAKTRIGQRKVSVPSVAVEFMEKIFSDLATKSLLLIGVGEIGEAVLRHLVDRGVKRIIICARRLERAHEVADPLGAKAVPLELLMDYLPEADIVVTASSATHHLILPETMDAVRQRRGDPVFLMDLAVPRNIHPGVGDLDNLYLYDIDDLESIVRKNLEERTQEVERCMTLVEAEVADFMNSLKILDASPLISRLSEALHGIGRAELERTLEKLKDLPPEGRAEVETLVRRVVSKILHLPLSALKQETAAGQGAQCTEAIERIFKLNSEDR